MRRPRFQTFLDGATALLLLVGVLLLASRALQGVGVRAGSSARDSVGSIALAEVIGVPVASPGDTVAVLAHDTSRAGLVLVFRSDCPVCARQRPLWDSLVASATAHGLNVVAFTPEPAEQVPAAYLSAIPVYAVQNHEVLLEAGITVVPSTLILDEEGAIREASIGLLSESMAERFWSALERLSS